MDGNQGLQGLQQRVLLRDGCTLCGACLSLCPYLRRWRGRVVKLHDCDLTPGRCHTCCPRTELDLGTLHQVVFGQPPGEVELGQVDQVLMARATDEQVRSTAQNGGVVSALLELALAEGLISAALLTGHDGDHLPAGRLARSTGEVRACAGSRYVSGPTLELLNVADFDPAERLAVVGLPCQVQALARLRAAERDRRTPVDQIELVLGLFCSWALDEAPFQAFLAQRFEGRPVRKLDITPPPDGQLVVILERGEERVPLDALRALVRPACAACLDLTSELADLSIGTVETAAGWNTLIVRSEQGWALVELARRTGVITAERLPPADLGHLRSAARQKKRRALEALRERGAESYLGSSLPQWTDRVQGEAP